MCLACEMEEELWAAYMDHMARQKGEQPAMPAAEPSDPAAATKAAPPASPFACEELPAE
jgi:hypothetical protein